MNGSTSSVADVWIALSGELGLDRGNAGHLRTLPHSEQTRSDGRSVRPDVHWNERPRSADRGLLTKQQTIMENLVKRHIRTITTIASALLITTAAAGCSDDRGEAGVSAAETHDAADKVDTGVVPAASSSAEPAVDVKNGTYGKMLVDQKGRTLYLFEKDTKNKSQCKGDCAKAWPPFIAKTAPTAGDGLKKDLLKTTKRDDASKQVTYNGHPLYRFADDQKAGDTNGQDVDAFGAKWFVVGPDGKKITTKPRTNDSGY
ncbi:hypothetical protein [Streptomyces sp. NBC_01789]|uniref:COG4315 family predicted lipoprotein n=1 Tax=unclassified Streptomyces TaxID=2593676 RepID=UPI0022570443|nr:hypothetical protein [Streptomyces sp. NBC_01789]MCX4451313.1 hypothetical protein [Streptomyces sp. NBC_01789]